MQEAYGVFAPLFVSALAILFAVTVWRRFTCRRKTNLPSTQVDRMYGASRPEAPPRPDAWKPD